MRQFKIAGESTADRQTEIFNMAFGGDGESATLKSWKKKHYANPAADGPKLFGAFDDEKLIGINGFLEMKYKYNDINFRVIQSCDTAVDPNYRKQGIFTNIIMSAEEEFRKQGYDVMIGFPNFNSYPGFIKMGWQEMNRTNKLFIPTNVQNVVKHMKGINTTKLSNVFTWGMWHKIRKYAKKDSVSIEKKKSITLEEYNECIDKSFIHFSMTEELLNWKLEDLFANYIIKKNDNKIARIVVTKYDYGDKLRRANIIISSCDEKYSEEYKIAMAKVLIDLKNDVDLICIWEPIYEFQKKALKELRFLSNIVAKEGSPFIIKILTEEEDKIKILSDSKNWNPKQIETDGMVNLNK